MLERLRSRARQFLAPARPGLERVARRLDGWLATSAPAFGRLRGAPLGLGLVALLGLVLATSIATGAGVERGNISGIAERVGPDISDAALNRYAANLDPSGLALARRHDPALTPASWGLTPGWENLSLTGRPPMDALSRTGIEIQRVNAAAPIVFGAIRPISGFAFRPASETDRRRAIRCLTQAIYYEAALEPRRGQEAVAQVVLNRVRDPNFPASVCGVVFQGAERVTGCQFSFTCDGSLARAPVAWAWNQADSVARAALAGHVAEAVGTATHYHADYVRPWWAPSLTKVNQLGAHIFYRWIGASGDTANFRQAYSGREPAIDEARFARPRLSQIIANAADLEAAGIVEEGRSVVIDGQVRQVGVLSLGGRRQATAADIAAINARMAEYEAAQPTPTVPQLEVEEINRPEPPAGASTEE